MAVRDRTRSLGLKLQQRTFRLETRKNFLPMRVVKRWKKLPREVVDCPSWDIFKSRLARHLAGLLQSGVLLLEQGAGPDLVRSPPALFLYDPK